jgi:hypothetical protein
MGAGARKALPRLRATERPRPTDFRGEEASCANASVASKVDGRSMLGIIRARNYSKKPASRGSQRLMLGK